MRRTPVPTPDSLKSELNRPQTPAIYNEAGIIVPFRRLLVMRGLPRDLVNALLSCNYPDGVHLDVHPGFVDALADRTAWRPAGVGLKQRAWRRRREQWEYADLARARRDGERAWRYPSGGYVWEYPEVVELDGEGEVKVKVEGDLGDLGIGFPPLVRVLPRERKGGRRVAVVFCRVGVWAETCGAVLFLGRTTWKVDGVPVCRAKRVGTAGETPGTDDVTATLEDVVLEAVREGWGEKDDQLPATIAEVVYHRWLELFDFLEPLPQTLCDKTAACYSQMMRSLELNIETDDDIPWGKLLERIQRRVALLSGLPARAAPISAPATPAKTSETMQQRTVSGVGTMRSNFSRRRRVRGHKTPTDENQRALDRLSYLGGVLIPLPIISGILSMGDVYGPDGTKFFVFWAVAVPLAGLTVLLIYADTIRKSQVWVEIGPEHVIPTPESKSESGSGAHIGPVDVEVRHRRTVTWRRHQTHRDHEEEEHPSPRQRDDVVFAVDHDVEERMIDMPPAVAAAATVYSSDEEVPDRLPRSARWSMGWGNVPSVILEQPSDGSKPKAWRREELGWRGAMQTILSKKFRDAHDVPEGVAASEKPGRRKTKSY
jgi:hypothetical protein